MMLFFVNNIDARRLAGKWKAVIDSRNQSLKKVRKRKGVVYDIDHKSWFADIKSATTNSKNLFSALWLRRIILHEK